MHARFVSVHEAGHGERQLVTSNRLTAAAAGRREEGHQPFEALVGKVVGVLRRRQAQPPDADDIRVVHDGLHGQEPRGD